MYCHRHSARSIIEHKCPDCPMVPTLCQKKIVTQVGIIIHFLQSEACGMNINKGIQASQLKQVLFVDEVN